MKRALLALLLVACTDTPTAPAETRAVVSIAASWGLDRINQRSLPLDGLYSPPASSGVTVYVVDTGIDYGHPEFGGRAVPGFDAFGGDGSATCHGHGTQVAGVVGGETFGVAPGVTLVSVKVFGCNGSAQPWDIIAGLNWIAANGVHPGVVNASFAEIPNPLIDQAVNALYAAGFLVVAGAANAAADACDVTPASVPVALTVGATNASDVRWVMSNSGVCVDLFAPGVNITSAAFGGGSVMASGTSLATPHVTGAAALYLASHPLASPGEVTDSLLAYSTKAVVTDGQSTAPHIVYSGSEVMGWTPPTPLSVPQNLTLTVSGSHKSGGTVFAHATWDWSDVPGTNAYTFNRQGFAQVPNIGSQTSIQYLTAGTYAARTRAVGPYAVSGWTPWLTSQICTNGSGKNGSAWVC